MASDALRLITCGDASGLGLAGVPGLEEHLRNLVTGAPTAEVGVVLADARKGVVTETRRHAYILRLLGVRQVILAVDKTSLAGGPADVFARIEADFRAYAARIGLREVAAVHSGTALLELLERAGLGAGASTRGDVAAAAFDSPATADQFDVTLIWTGANALLPGRDYVMKIATRTVMATVMPLRYKVNVDTLEHVAADKLQQDEIGCCQLELDHAIPFKAYAVDPNLGGFILIDRVSNETVATGMLNFALRRSHNLHWQALDIDRTARAAAKAQRPCVIWFTGLSGAGKSTIANLVEKRLHALGRHTYLLDGDNIRLGLNKDLGFTEEARVENIRRVAEVARLMADAGLVVLCAFISPFRSERRMARALLPEGEFIEVHVDVPLDVAERRDPKGLYRKARAGTLSNFTGVDSPYEPPEKAEIVVDTSRLSAEEAAARVVEEMRVRGL